LTLIKHKGEIQSHVDDVDFQSYMHPLTINIKLLSLWFKHKRTLVRIWFIFKYNICKRKSKITIQTLQQPRLNVRKTFLICFV